MRPPCQLVFSGVARHSGLYRTVHNEPHTLDFTPTKQGHGMTQAVFHSLPAATLPRRSTAVRQPTTEICLSSPAPVRPILARGDNNCMLPRSSAGHPGKQAAQRGRWKVSGAGAQRERPRLLREVLVDGGRLLAELLHAVERVAVLRNRLLQAAHTHSSAVCQVRECERNVHKGAFRCRTGIKKLLFPQPSRLGVEVLRRNLRRSEQRYVVLNRRDAFQYLLRCVTGDSSRTGHCVQTRSMTRPKIKCPCAPRAQSRRR